MVACLTGHSWHQLHITRRERLGSVTAVAVLSTVPHLAGAAPGGTELGEIAIKPYDGPAGGRGSVKSVATVLRREGLLIDGPEPKIIAELAKATLPPNPKVNWDGWVADYATIRNSMEETWPEIFKDYNKRLWTPGGFARPVAARTRQWKPRPAKPTFLSLTALCPIHSAKRAKRGHHAPHHDAQQ